MFFKIFSLAMPVRKRLLIQAGSINDQNKTVPVNTGKFVDVTTDLGVFSVSVYIRNFDGSSKHRENSLYNALDETTLDGTTTTQESESEGQVQTELPNLRILIKFQPNADINGSNLFFGNECSVPVKEYVPTTLMSTGLRFFKWFLNPTIESDLYGDRPFIYGLALNSFSKMGIADRPQADFLSDKLENLLWETKTNSEVTPTDRRKYFCTVENAKKFEFEKSKSYYMMFDTNFLKLGDSSYNVSLPALGKQTFDVNVLRFANEKLDNIHWTIKKSVDSDLAEGVYGLVLNFRLVEEDVPEQTQL
ncbi:Protein of unknown function DUF1769 [Metschnikowia aff. pulcherrima]|uniref:Domain of unknown function at the cortex 1 domain-containing protein n=1 Tax=Metschnikowia aff. pulcherrima TaxID=2163413 RepID=A0A4P6XQK1_9ASCO|nr:Protein of unknown function DUF1769 [Metschnikowia aff. pulcherrima]